MKPQDTAAGVPGGAVARGGARVLAPLLAVVAASGPMPGPLAVAGETTCVDCHRPQAEAFGASVHAAAGVACRTCHGGAKRYAAEPMAPRRLGAPASRAAASAPVRGSSGFDHGPAFRHKPSRREIPERCGTCHADVERMNPYGLPTDQLAQYRTSGHGRALFEKHDERVAVCTDCHGVHRILKPNDPESPVFPKNVPATCGRCHSRPSRMDRSQLSVRVVEQYRESVHGVGLLEGGDLGMPNCATCHGSHSAVPPGFEAVGHVCGRCHQQEEQQFRKSPHAKFSMFPRCVGCHTRSVDERDHRIGRVVATPDAIKAAYERIVQTRPAADAEDPEFQAAFAAQCDPPIRHVERICARCHRASETGAHRVFFGELNEQAVETGAAMYDMIREAELRYAATASRVDHAGRGVLLVTDEALLAEELRTQIVGLGPLQHTLDLQKLQDARRKLDALADQIDGSLDAKLRGLRWRHWGLVPMWGFLLIFVSALWIKYKRLKKALVRPAPG